MAIKIIHPQGVCSREMVVDYNEDSKTINNVQIQGGCQGNTKGVCQLLIGRKISEVIPLLEGIPCRGSRTGMSSCPDQLAKGLKDLL